MSCVQDVFGYKDAAELCLCVPQLLDEAHCVSSQARAGAATCCRLCCRLHGQGQAGLACQGGGVAYVEGTGHVLAKLSGDELPSFLAKKRNRDAAREHRGERVLPPPRVWERAAQDAHGDSGKQRGLRERRGEGRLTELHGLQAAEGDSTRLVVKKALHDPRKGHGTW